MINIQIVNYIKEQTAKGDSLDTIKNNLKTGGGWSDEDIQEALVALGLSQPVSAPVVPTIPQVPQAPIFAQPQAQTSSTPVSSMEVKYAGFWVRVIAFYIDGIIASLLGVVIFIILFFSPRFLTETSLSLVLNILGYIVILSYFIILTYKYKATTGKKIMGLIVISDEDDKELSLGRIILRETVGRFLSTITIVGYLITGFTNKKQALHDFLARSVVVYKDPKKSISGLKIFFIILSFILVIFIVIGLLFSLVVYNLNLARTKNTTAQSLNSQNIYNSSQTVGKISPGVIKQTLANAFPLGENYWGSNSPYTYKGVCNASSGLEILSKKLSSMGDSNFICNDSKTAWAMSAQLGNNTNSFWCVDSTGTSTEVLKNIDQGVTHC